MTTLLVSDRNAPKQGTTGGKRSSGRKGKRKLEVARQEQPEGDLSSWPVPRDRVAADGVWVELFSRANMPSKFGDFKIFVFRSSVDDKEHVALVRGEVRNAEGVPVRLHSECLTGDVLGSLRCDCREQLESALSALGKSKVGILLYMRQEGRGIGLGNKVRAYALQEQGLDTFEANQHLGFDDDLRSYDVAALMLKMFGPTSVKLLTNNPRKVFGLRAAGIDVRERAGLVALPNAHNGEYLASKARSGHILPLVETS